MDNSSFRVCRLYVAVEKPSMALHWLCHFVVTNYGPDWFAIKCRPSCYDGPKNLYLATQLVKLVPKGVADIVKPYIARDAYYAHPENLLLVMMTDSDLPKRQKAVNTVLNIRAAKSSNCSTI